VALILVIEDDAMVRCVIYRSLAQAGHAVLEAPDAAIARKLLHALDAEVVIADVHLPGEDGVSAMTDIRRSHPTLPLVFVSGGDQAELAERLDAASLGRAVWTVLKPFSPQELVAAVSAALAAPLQQ
jgi:DNA-binding response OmpR family regulator